VSDVKITMKIAVPCDRCGKNEYHIPLDLRLFEAAASGWKSFKKYAVSKAVELAHDEDEWGWHAGSDGTALICPYCEREDGF
jgi:hypothetical protein